MGRKYTMPLDLGLVVKDKNAMVRVNKICKDEKEAEKWEEDFGHTANNDLTLVLKHQGIESVEAIYDRSDFGLLFYNIELDTLSSKASLDIETPYGTFNIDNLGELYKQLKEFTELEETKEIIQEVASGDHVFATPTYGFKGENGERLLIELWLNEFGYRHNKIQAYFK